MGRCPLLYPLAALIAFILISDSIGCRRPMEPPLYGEALCFARILELREAETAGLIALAEIDSVNGHECRPFRARLLFLSDERTLSAGMGVWFRSELKPLGEPPAVPDVVDLQRSLRLKGAVASAQVVGDSLRASAPLPGVMPWLRRANEDALTHLRRLPLETESINMLAAMLLGRAEMLPASTREVYTAAGLSHILALSGMHVGIIAMVIAMALWPLYFTRHLRTRLLLSAAALWLYAAFTGFSPSVTRAVIMATVYMGARMLQRRSQPLNSLCLAALLILLFSPNSLYAIGFQLSFAAVAGIIVFFPLINRVGRHDHPRLYALVSYPALSISAMIFTSIIAAWHFHTFPLYFLVANLLAAPLIPCFLVSGIMSMFVGLCWPTDLLARGIEWVAELSAALPEALVSDVYPPLWFVVGFCVALLVLGLALNNSSRFGAWLGAIAGAACCAAWALTPPERYPAHEEYVVEEPRSTQLIVRHGSRCTLHTTAIAPAERLDVVERYELILRDFLARRGVDSLELERVGAPVGAQDSLVGRPAKR